MIQEQTVYRPPMEADSLIIRVTTGCAHNKCTFCTMYKDRDFHVKKPDEVIRELKEARVRYPHIRKIFLADGDAFVLKTAVLEEILKTIQTLFPECVHVASYARFTDVLRKSPEELKLLHELGLKKLYLGLESGSNDVLAFVNKNLTADEAIKATHMLKDAGIISYTIVLLGLGGKQRSDEHIEKTAQVLNAMNPDYAAVMTLMTSDAMPLMKDVKAGRFELLSPAELVEEALQLVQRLDLHGTILRINHASNFVNVQGVLPDDKAAILDSIAKAQQEDLNMIDGYRRF